MGSDGGFVILVHSKIDKERRVHLDRLVSWYGRNSSSLSRRRSQQKPKGEQLSTVGKRVWQSSSLIKSNENIEQGSGSNC